jgi:hypothetical protein
LRSLLVRISNLYYTRHLMETTLEPHLKAIAKERGVYYSLIEQDWQECFGSAYRALKLALLKLIKYTAKHLVWRDLNDQIFNLLYSVSIDETDSSSRPKRWSLFALRDSLGDAIQFIEKSVVVDRVLGSNSKLTTLVATMSLANEVVLSLFKWFLDRYEYVLLFDTGVPRKILPEDTDVILDDLSVR